jgi:hypothetical protein
MSKPQLILQNQFGETSFNVVESEATEYSGAGSAQVIGPDLYVSADVGSDDASDPSFIATIMGNIIGADLENQGNYLAGVIGAYSLTGTKSSSYPAGAVLGIIMDGVTDADGAVVAVIDGDSGVTKANAAFKARMLNSTAGSGVDYGLDLHDAGFGDYDPLAILKADLRLSGQICVLSGASAPVDGTTGDNFAGKGSIYIAQDTGLAYQQTGLISNPTWKLMANAGASPASVTGALLTGLAAGTNTAIAASDTILEALAKLQAQVDAL